MNHQQYRRLSFIPVLLAFSLLLAPVTAQNTVTIGLTRNMGIGLGGLIQGTFTLTASGSEEIQNLTVYFNGEEVYFSEGNSLAWQFNTDEYPSGTTNITVIGWDDLGTEYMGSYSTTFLGPLATNIIVFGIITIVIILVIVRYGPALAKRRRGN